MNTYAEIRRAVLELINQSTIAGEDVALTYNNQADYVRRIPNLINQAVMKIRTTTLPERRIAELSGGTRRDGGTAWSLPDDCRALVSGGVLRMTPKGQVRTNLYRLLGRTLLVLEPWPPSDRERRGAERSGVLIEYFAYPVQLPQDPDDDYPFEETPEVVQAAEYYAAAMLVMMEDQFSYATLMNEYESRLASMVPPLTAEIRPVEDVYGFGLAFCE